MGLRESKQVPQDAELLELRVISVRSDSRARLERIEAPPLIFVIQPGR
jgi:hypothetical protein